MNNIQKLAANGNKNHRIFAATVVDLMNSQGFYGRLYRSVNEMDGDRYKQLYDLIGKQESLQLHLLRRRHLWEARKMKIIFYYYNSTGTLFLSYSDGNGGYTDHAYVFYSLREAIQQFRREYRLQRKHIRVIKLY